MAMVATRTATTPARTRLANDIARLRSIRSTNAPEGMANNSQGRKDKAVSAPTRTGSRVNVIANSGMAARTMPSPRLETTLATSSRQ